MSLRTSTFTIALSFFLLPAWGSGTALGTDEPTVRMHVPGFTVKRLAIPLTNINNVEYAPDGRLFAAGYDGRIHILTDSNGDGLEDKATTFWDKEGDLLVPVGIAVRREGVYVVSKGKVSLLKDSNGDGRADKSEVIATGWPEEVHSGSQRADALGIAFDADGALYFSLGCADYANAYQLDKDGTTRYDMRSERGTIIKVSPDRKRREIYATGIRFAVGLAINRSGDLFATDQEGATWLPNGNPLDELLHIQRGRHYGFPPRHAKHLPNVVDAPAVATYGPQHQSTCGFRFNEANGRPTFGPAFWQGDALVTGEARGKLYRTPLVKTPTGYVGRPILIGTVGALAVDVALSPAGALVVSGHGGKPDWGSGPRGEGHLFKISYADRQAPQPVAAWAAGPREVRIAFDRPLAPERIAAVAIETGEHVREADRFEPFRPGYQAVSDQQLWARRRLRVIERSVIDDGHTLSLKTAPHPWVGSYAIAITEVAAPAAQSGAVVDLRYDLSGAEAEWVEDGHKKPDWRGWLPHLDLAVATAWTKGSRAHDALAARLARRGILTLRARLNLPAQVTRLKFVANDSFKLHLAGKTLNAENPPHDSGSWQVTAEMGRGNRTASVAIALSTGRAANPALTVSYLNERDSHEHALDPERLLVPWAPTTVPTKPPGVKSTSPLLTGNPVRGKALFFGDAKCGACHSFRGAGGTLAPDLSNSHHRDPAALLQDIIDPNAAINPDHISFGIEMTDGQLLEGVISADEAGKLRILDATGVVRVVERAQIKQLRPSEVSLMPEGFKTLGEQSLRDLITFLVTQTPGAGSGKKDAKTLKHP